MASNQEVSRPLAEFPSTIWENLLVSFSADNDSASEPYKNQSSVLREKVRGMLMASAGNAIENAKFIDTLCRLGVSYHFQTEIEEQLREIYNVHLNDITKNLDDYDVHTVALLFHTLRSHGYKMASDVFKKFRKEDGKFNETLAADARAMLSLYEAAQWSVTGEEILDEAIALVMPRLESLADHSPPHLAKYIINVLARPYHKDMPRIAARCFISFYEEEGTRNQTLLEFAKLDFKLLQLLYRQELNQVSRWCKDLNLFSQLPYARNKIVEAYFWGIGTYFEPQYSRARIIFAKKTILASFLNDTYDAYGTFEELCTLTDTIERWEVDSIDKLPDHIKIISRAIFNYYAEIEKELKEENRSECFVYLKNALKQYAKSYHQEAKWLNQVRIPTFEEYIKNAMITGGYHSITLLSTTGMGQVADLAAIRWLYSWPKVLEACQIIGRIMNDVTSYKFERQRKHCTSSVECYAKQYGLSEEEATEELQKMVNKAWKDLNEAFMRPNEVPRPLVQRYLDLSRVTYLFYKDGDAYTLPELLKDYIVSLLVEDIPM